MKITKKHLQEIIKEELQRVLEESNVDVLDLDRTLPRPSALELQDEPAAAYAMQRISQWVTTVSARFEALERELQEIKNTLRPS